MHYIINKYYHFDTVELIFKTGFGEFLKKYFTNFMKPTQAWQIAMRSLK
jgi:hypothetical protein